MTSGKKSTNTAIFLDSYESETSKQASNDRHSYMITLAQNMVSKIKKIFRAMKKDTFRTIFNASITGNSSLPGDYDQSNDEEKQHDIENDNNDQNIQEDNAMNVYDGKLRLIKLNILHVKLLSLYGIFNRYIKANTRTAFEKIRLKVHMEKLFSRDDNFLYILPRPKLFKFKNHYAYRRLVYVIKAYKCRVNFIIVNFFSKWRDLITIIPGEYSGSSSNMIRVAQTPKAKLVSNLKSLSDTCQKIIVKRQSLFHMLKLAFYKWYQISNTNPLGKLLPSAMNILSAVQLIYLLFQRIKRSFINNLHTKANPSQLLINIESDPYYNSIKDDIAKIQAHIGNDPSAIHNIHTAYLEACKELPTREKQEKDIFRTTRALKGFYKMFSLIYASKPLLKYFHQWEKVYINIHQCGLKDINVNASKSNSDLKCDAVGNGTILLNLFYKNKFQVDIYWQKKKFFTKCVDLMKLHNTLKEYGFYYKKVLNMVSENRRVDIMLMRSFFKKMFSVAWIIMLVIKKQFQLTKHNKSLKHSNLLACFYRWKAYIIVSIRLNCSRCYKTCILFTRLENKFSRRDKAHFFNRLKLIPKIAERERNLILIFVNSVYLILRKVMLKINFKTFNQFFFTYQYRRILNRNLSAKLIHQFLKRNSIHTAYETLADCFTIWKKNIPLSCTIKDLLSLPTTFEQRYYKLKPMIFINYLLNIRPYFYKFKLSTTSKKIYFRQRKVGEIDHDIIRSMSGILLEYENEDNKLNREILKHKFSMTRGSAFMKFIYRLHSLNLFHSFNKWRIHVIQEVHEGMESYEQLLNQATEIKNESNLLVEAYREKKKNYRKTISDYEDMKNHFCQECLGGDFEVDYKSINNDMGIEEEEQEKGDMYYKTHSSSALEENFRLDSKEEEFQKPNKETLSSKVADMEKKIKGYQNEYNARLKYYESYLESLEERKKVSFVFEC